MHFSPTPHHERLSKLQILKFSSPSPEIKSVRRHVDTVSHFELQPLKAGHSIQNLGVTVFVRQGFKCSRLFLFYSRFSPDTAATEPESKGNIPTS